MLNPLDVVVDFFQTMLPWNHEALKPLPEAQPATLANPSGSIASRQTMGRSVPNPWRSSNPSSQPAPPPQSSKKQFTLGDLRLSFFS